MPARRVFSEIQLVNGSTGDPVLYIDYPDINNALLLDAGDNARLPFAQLADLEAVFITHHHVDHFIGLDRIIRANIDSDKTLSIYGPEGTIRKVTDRIRSYEYQFFPFQKIVIRVVDVLPDCLREAVLECRRRFPEPEVTEQPRSGRTVYTTARLQVEAVAVDHTVPCLAWAIVEEPGYHFDARAADKGVLRAGDWVGKVLRLLQDKAPPETHIAIQGGTFRLDQLQKQFFRRSAGARIAYVTDTAWSEQSQPGLLELARGAEWLYCDSFYSEAQRKQADKYRHMTATDAATLARDAGAERLTLIHFSRRYTGRYEQLIDEARRIFPAARADLSAEPPA